MMKNLINQLRLIIIQAGFIFLTIPLESYLLVVREQAKLMCYCIELNKKSKTRY